MDKQTITIYDVAREAEVSMATVSRVVNGNPNVKPATRKRVLEVIERLDYRPNAVARGLASKKTTTVGVIIPDVTDMFFSSLARGIDDVATMYQYNIILANSEEGSQQEVQVLNTLLAKQVDGLIYMGNQITDAVRAEFSRSKTPIVLAGSVDPDEQVGSVNIDYVQSMKAATKQLLDSGNERVAFVTGPMIQPVNGQFRLVGYKAALEEAGIPFDESLVFETETSYHAGLSIFKQVQKSGATAVITGSDELAVGLLNAALDSGVKVPEDFEIISSSNTKLTEMARPQLTSIDQPLYDIGAVAMRLLTKMMNKEEIEEKTVRLGFDITKRHSTR